eukprot:TRINITY_DN987_c0_g1_i3.p1 TRINITY_DN987_c0_g1~~TRINITY_DN987_c0_g1_i3.p1  ORF type:complete len:574 (-),score=102.35 TRINITY_DN987_c0_g1_i3:366-2087(-)
MISLGSGGASGGHPVIPSLFVWNDAASDSQVLFAFDHGYGGGLHVLSDGTALYCAWNTDNGGPMSKQNVAGIYSQLRSAYKNANVHSSSFNDFYDAAQKVGYGGLPIISQEIGDTWLYGVPSDPYKNVMFREMSRARRECLEEGACQVEDVEMRRFDRLLTKIPEHTWGEDTTWYLGQDYANWTNSQFEAALRLPNYRMTVDSWRDQRNYLHAAIRILSNATSPDVYAQLGTTIQSRLEAIQPARPDPSHLGYTPASGSPAEQAAQIFKCRGWQFSIGSHGGVSMLNSSSRSWVNPQESSGLARFTYQTLSPDDITAFDDDYGMGQCGPMSETVGCHNFQKPNMSSADPEHTENSPTLKQIWYVPTRHGDLPSPNDLPETCRLLVSADLPEIQQTKYGAPSTVWLGIQISNSTSDSSISVDFDVQWFNKSATRLTEASWVTFHPVAPVPGWRLHPYLTGMSAAGADDGVDPTDVVEHGAVHLHSLGPLGFVEYQDQAGSFTVRPYDSPIVSAGLLSPFPTPGVNTSIAENIRESGMHWNLQNNVWNTNFPQWYPFEPRDADARFRFQVTVSDH